MSDAKGNEVEEEIFNEEWEQRLAEDPEYASRVFKAIEGLVPDILKRTLMSGLGNTLLNEDGLRSLIAEKKLPKEAMGFLLSQASGMRREILRIISREIRVFLENMDFGGEIAKILTTLSFEIKTEIRFIPNDAAVKPSIRNKIKIKRQRGADEAPVEGLDDEDEVLESVAPKKEAPAAEKPAEKAPERSRRTMWGLRPRRGEGEDSES
jgi:hypothetical protein